MVNDLGKIMIILPPFGVKGFLRLQTINKFSGKCRIDTGWFPNSVLFEGMNRMGGYSDYFNYAQVGTNNTTPQQTDTGLLGWHAGTNTIMENFRGAAASPPYYGYRQKRFRFGAGTVAANLSEAGVGWGSTGATLWNRALIVDLLGNPTTVTPLADELLDLTAQIRYYPPLVDVTGVKTIGGENFNYLVRAAEVTNSDWWGNGIGTVVQHSCAYTSDWQVYDGEPGTLTQNPSGVAAAIDFTNGVSSNAYSNNSYTRTMNFNCGPNGWNAPGLLRTLRFRTTAGSYQIRLGKVSDDSPLNKTSAKVIDGQFQVSWSEYVVP